MNGKRFGKAKAVALLVAALIFAWVSVSQAAWSITQTKSTFKTNLAEWFIVTLDCTSDASGTDTALEYNVTGYYLYAVQTDPGDGDDAPSAAYTLDVQDALNATLLALTGRTTNTIQIASGHTTLGIFPAISSTPSVVMSTLGNANKTTVYLYFVR